MQTQSTIPKIPKTISTVPSYFVSPKSPLLGCWKSLPIISTGVRWKGQHQKSKLLVFFFKKFLLCVNCLKNHYIVICFKVKSTFNFFEQFLFHYSKTHDTGNSDILVSWTAHSPVSKDNMILSLLLGLQLIPPDIEFLICKKFLKPRNNLAYSLVTTDES